VGRSIRHAQCSFGGSGGGNAGVGLFDRMTRRNYYIGNKQPVTEVVGDSPTYQRSVVANLDGMTRQETAMLQQSVFPKLHASLSQHHCGAFGTTNRGCTVDGNHLPMVCR